MRHVYVSALALFALSSSAQTQTGGFVMTLGRDTVQVEQFRRSGNTIEGLLATRSPTSKLLRYTIEVGADGRMTKYSQRLANVDATAPDPSRATLTYVGDTIVREAMQRGELLTHRIFAPDGGFPFSTIPIGSSFLVLEFALARARASGMASKPVLVRLGTFAGQTQPSRTPVLFAAPDSVDVDYFGQGRFGTKFDSQGRLIRSDWRGTTYKTLVVRVDEVDPASAARRWAEQDAAGNSFGRLSVRDTVRARVGSSNITIDYSRPAARGRKIWGDVVPWNVVWRLGADFATQITTDKDLQLGEYLLPAGAYTLWMLPSETAPQLIINKQTGIFGTQYNPAHDFIRLPVTAATTGAPTERLTIAVMDGQLSIDWAGRRYWIPIAVR